MESFRNMKNILDINRYIKADINDFEKILKSYKYLDILREDLEKQFSTSN